MNRYELTYIIDTGVEESARKELIEKFAELIRSNGGEIEKVDETWGKRRLAYAINDMWEGWYVLVTFKANGNLPKEIERNLEINDKILRYLIIKLEEKKQSVKPRPVRTVVPMAAPETAEAPEAAPEAPSAEATPATPAE
ncbi:MAG: 30S ribosomal protein S6 [Clostridiales bacterium]|nr:30S ribosomal protein S6 [Clostridiales bacterium]